MIGLIRKLPVSLSLVIALPLCTPVHAEKLNVVGELADTGNFRFHEVSADMGAEQYRETYRDNQGKLRRFVEDYSESRLVSLGMPREGVRLLGAVAATAVTQDATFYLNDSKLLAINLTDLADEDRAVSLGVRLRW